MNTLKMLACSVLLATSVLPCKNEKNKEAQVEEHTEDTPKTAKDSADLEKLRYADNLQADPTLVKPQPPENYDTTTDSIDK